MVQIQSRASPGFTRSCSSTWLERITPSHPLMSNWQSEQRGMRRPEEKEEEGVKRWDKKRKMTERPTNLFKVVGFQMEQGGLGRRKSLEDEEVE